MLILTIRTDSPEAELGLYQNDQRLAYQIWQAHRELGRTIHAKVAELLQETNKDWHDIQGVIGFRGPGSFTGLRIGLTVANTLADNLQCPIVGSAGDNWIESGLERLLAGTSDVQIMPEYGSDPHITAPRK